MSVQRVVCPVDFSPASKEALHAAIEMARRFDVPLHLIHAWDMRAVLMPAAAGVMPVVDLTAIQEQLTNSLEEWRAEAERARGQRVEARLYEGTPWTCIVDETGPADLIVIGTHGRTGLRRVLLGSVAERVVRHAQGWVLTVRASHAATQG